MDDTRRTGDINSPDMETVNRQLADMGQQLRDLADNRPSTYDADALADQAAAGTLDLSGETGDKPK